MTQCGFPGISDETTNAMHNMFTEIDTEISLVNIYLKTLRGLTKASGVKTYVLFLSRYLQNKISRGLLSTVTLLEKQKHCSKMLPSKLYT